VYLQRKGSRGWSDIQAARVSSGGFKLTVKPTGVGTYSFRVRSQSGAVVSSTLYLKVQAQLADGPYRLVYVNGCLTYRLWEGKLTIRGAAASFTLRGAKFTGPVTRTGSAVKLALRTAGGRGAIDFTGTVKPYNFLTGKLTFSGIHDTLETGFTCTTPVDAYGPAVPGPSCALSVIKRVRLPAGATWEDSAPVCTGTWAVGWSRYRGDEIPSSEVLKWNGTAWALYPGDCSPKYEAILPVFIYRSACWQD